MEKKTLIPTKEHVFSFFLWKEYAVKKDIKPKWTIGLNCLTFECLQGYSVLTFILQPLDVMSVVLSAFCLELYLSIYYNWLFNLSNSYVIDFTETPQVTFLVYLRIIEKRECWKWSRKRPTACLGWHHNVRRTKEKEQECNS